MTNPGPRPQSPHLSLQQKRILERILRSEHGATRGDILYVLYSALNIDEPEYGFKVVHVQLHHIRKVLAPHGITIVTADHIKHADGARYFIPKEDHPKARKFLAERDGKITMAKSDWDDFVKEEAVK